MKFARTWPLLIVAAAAVASTGCAVRTRLGAVIPGHAASEKLEGELVTATFIPFTEPAEGTAPDVPGGSPRRSSFIPGAGEAIGALVKVAVEAVRQELLREAEKYEHQYSARLLLTSDDLRNGGVVLVTRWIHKPQPLFAFENPSTQLPIEQQMIPSPYTQVVAPIAESELQNTIKGIIAGPPNGAPIDDKEVAAALTLRITPEASSPSNTFVYRLSGARLYVKAAGAKVVDFGWRNLPKIWQWPGALIFATDAQMGFGATMETKALVASKTDTNKNTTEATWINITPESDVLRSVNINLDKLPMVTPMGSDLGSWMVLPTIGDEKKRAGFAVMNFRFTERDSSNAKKYIVQAADALKAQEGALSDLAKKAVDGD